jgi:hypothetical protein
MGILNTISSSKSFPAFNTLYSTKERTRYDLLGKNNRNKLRTQPILIYMTDKYFTVKYRITEEFCRIFSAQSTLTTMHPSQPRI